jgi:hypothetical protein
VRPSRPLTTSFAQGRGRGWQQEVRQTLPPALHCRHAIVSEQQLERVTDYLSIARQEGARAVSGSQQLTEGSFAKGYFVPPTVYADVRDDMGIAREEIFGPVISAIPFTDIEDVIRRGNSGSISLRGTAGEREAPPIVTAEIS